MASDPTTEPPWLTSELAALRLKYPRDRVGAIQRRFPDDRGVEWRLKCLDCPGKLYKPGPDETLLNFEVHLRNRYHRRMVNERLELQCVVT
ncbi:hypothetical protein DL96DRAFT_1627508 [Flagelloscypha sp. PMI_526]|nr:hypothetical protein DL96DRAFT_1627508 [Flagelloscypha sp. PMI_526]